MSLTLPAPAKLNLMLHITGRRDDGYHLLQTVFQLLDHGDTLTFEAASGSELTLTPDLEGVAEHDNLIIRAAKLLRRHTGCTQGAHISLEKRLPMGGGIGGGSSNAATTLVGLNALWELNLSLDELAELGATLGADVPVFVRGRSAFAEGVGERLTAIALPEIPFIVLHPGPQISTKTVFGAPDLPRATPILSKDEALSRRDNDCEAIVCAHYPAIDDALAWLSAFGPARLTGTGGCVFCPLTSHEEADNILRRIQQERDARSDRQQWQAFIANGLNTSPLHIALNKVG
ncbi:4-(cytidine 5'-diphospho)-2-C-methyl-D-erythritol kinase [Larsenimonas salina]|uniref:4-(cytidine 5'-diphospho)-2-C-methyl-D-erythritol kinase n=1 Tax=Larsenimonas salina TaxID=1295565 RepID=UPI0020736BE2|nr:4-(cytidine 5'-diphospho)-2-C-methyl-D-erythritol kinase [Larsenimonas salina]MCM5703074.1 4-(cytidine 5'-diphospho)-2-C-methyl-D-erythritol kinase [Larsenimonas salina]